MLGVEPPLLRGPRHWRVAAVVLVALIVVLGVIPTHETLHAVVGGGEDTAANSAHFIEYAALAFVLAVALEGWRPSRRGLALAGLASIALGIGIELVQLALPYRSAQLSDGLLDVAGTLVGLALVSWAARMRAKRSPRSHPV
jgi:hypothetical protein